MRATPSTAAHSSTIVVEPKKLISTRRIHYAFTVLYGLAVVVLMTVSVIGVDYATCATNGLLAFNVGVAFLLFGTTLVGRQTLRLYDEFRLYQDCVVLVAMACTLSLIATLYPIVRIVQTLAVDCTAAPPSTSPICSTEYGFAIFWVCFMLLLCILNICTAALYIWMKY